MNKAEETKWAGTEQYEFAKKFLEENGNPTNNEYLYQKVLTAKGYTVYFGDLKNWIKAQSVSIDLSKLA